MNKFLILPVFAVALSSAAPSRAQTTPLASSESRFFFRDGDRAMLLGDSITEQRQYTTLIESYTLSRFPRWKISFRNTGVSGDRAHFGGRGGQESGLKRDIFPLNPTAITIAFGMNDARAGEAGLKTYVDTSRTLTEALLAKGTRVALLTPSSEENYEAGQPAGSTYNVVLRKYSEGLKGLATEKNVLFVDQLNPMIATIEAGRAANVLSNVPGDPRLVPDSVHPNAGGHLVMATHILKGLGARSLVSNVEIDAKTLQFKAQNAAVTTSTATTATAPMQGDIPIIGKLLRTENAPISFTRLDGALPWHVPTEAAVALKIPGFSPLNDLSNFALKVVNLPVSQYEISIGEQTVGTFTSEQLAAGINLSQNAGPISAQAQELHKKILEKNNLFFTRWRQIQIFRVPAWMPQEAVETARSAEMARLDAQIAAAEGQIDVLRQPKPHVWSIKPVATATP